MGGSADLKHVARETRPRRWLRNALPPLSPFPLLKKPITPTGEPEPARGKPSRSAGLTITHYPLPITHYLIPNSQIIKIFLTVRISPYIKLLNVISH
ncbi:MAG: hypothetical protein KME31_07080 [Tolypothrix carrinoi HA7290-LM1]|nr:hypothetical protein [Tolypothrix carrinoi HA7290-LM1]